MEKRILIVLTILLIIPISCKKEEIPPPEIEKPECLTNADCDDQNELTQDLCQEQKCTHIFLKKTCQTDKDCDDNNPQTLDICMPEIKTCSYQILPKEEIEKFECLTDADCDDQNLNTIDICDPALHVCFHKTIEITPTPAPPQPIPAPAPTLICSSNSECHDNNPNTNDNCIAAGTVNSRCTNPPIYCSTPPCNYNVAIIYLTTPNYPVQQSHLNTLNQFESDFDRIYAAATNNKIILNSNIIQLQLPSTSDYEYQALKQFYQTNPDNYDFIILFNSWITSFIPNQFNHQSTWIVSSPTYSDVNTTRLKSHVNMAYGVAMAFTQANLMQAVMHEFSHFWLTCLGQHLNIEKYGPHYAQEVNISYDPLAAQGINVWNFNGSHYLFNHPSLTQTQQDQIKLSNNQFLDLSLFCIGAKDRTQVNPVTLVTDSVYTTGPFYATQIAAYTIDQIAPLNNFNIGRDSDNDGLPDWLEIQQYQTNFINPDTDGDGINDYQEIINNKDPLDPNN